MEISAHIFVFLILKQMLNGHRAVSYFEKKHCDVNLDALFTRTDNELIYIRPDKFLTLCQLLTGRMGSRSILPIIVTIIIDTMLKLYRAKFKINSVSVRVNKAGQIIINIYHSTIGLFSWKMTRITELNYVKLNAGVVTLNTHAHTHPPPSHTHTLMSDSCNCSINDDSGFIF